ncbi:zinc transporter 7-like isoform X2 [Varroa jacobsoni]|uniref:Cation efflux protein transmembrane domain-containing protein n=1 Tax=Varroa destructor TaxID=109461 RepID=A0A7M7M9U4_VARDE|nr:zinc transporter 7-like isoform X1 [Varroa destructor]XP_022687815.1 zinc transporter 7-like isoform X2 [Varroa jacobsoni]
MLPIHIDDKEYKYRSGPGRVKEWLLHWIRVVLSDQATRNLFLFLCINLGFAFVELFYGLWTNSLGLISDSFHMFFDCSALVTGLVASIIMKWRPNERFTFGYVRAEVLAGFVNGLFLVFIAFFILSEAVERLMEPPEVKHERLFLVSVAGLFVNLIGIFALNHGGHGHSHGSSGHGHSHDHGHVHNHGSVDKTDNILLNMAGVGTGHENGLPLNGHTSHGGHGHSHGGSSCSTGVGSRSQLMQGVLLHILADTLGSVGVIVSAFLVSQFRWMIADPLCSMFIAILILISVYPLLKESISVLMQRVPHALDGQLQSCFQRVSALDGVYSVQDKHFWTLCSGVYIGNMKLEVARRADLSQILSHTQAIFKQIGVDKLYVQMEYAAM